MKTPYTPREGSLPARLIAHLQEHGGSMGRKQIAELLDIPPNNVPPNMAAAVHHGALVRDGGSYRLPLGAATLGTALQDTWGGGNKPTFPTAPPRAGEPITTAAQAEEPAQEQPAPTPRKMRTLKQVSQEFHRERNRPAKGKVKAKAKAKTGTALVAVAKAKKASSTAVAHLEPIDLQPASLRQVGGTHYKQMGVQPWDVVDGWPLEARIGYYRGNALKYLMRMGSKDEELQEIEKCAHYVDKLREVLRERDARVAA